MPPHEPSASWRASDPLDRRGAAPRAAAASDRPPLVAVQHPVEQLQDAPGRAYGRGPGGGRRRCAARRCRTAAGARGRWAATTVSGDDRLAGPAGEVVDVERAPATAGSITSGGIAGRSSHDHRPNSASQMRVNTRVASTPPCAGRTPPRPPCGAASSGRRPAAARRRPRRSSTGRRARRGTSPRCRRPAAGSGSTRRSAGPGRASSTPRNSRSSRSSASIVTLVSSSPFHQPSPSCIAQQRVDAPVDGGAHVDHRPASSSVTAHDEAGDVLELGGGRRGRTLRSRLAKRGSAARSWRCPR